MPLKGHHYGTAEVGVVCRPEAGEREKHLFPQLAGGVDGMGLKTLASSWTAAARHRCSNWGLEGR